MTRSDVLDRLTAILADVARVDPATVSTEKTFDGDLEVDSLSLVEVVVEAEARFGIRVSDHDIDEFVTVGDVVAHIEQQLTVA